MKAGVRTFPWPRKTSALSEASEPTLQVAKTKGEMGGMNVVVTMHQMQESAGGFRLSGWSSGIGGWETNRDGF